MDAGIEKQEALNAFAQCFMDHVLDDPADARSLQNAFEKIQLKDAIYTQYDSDLLMHYQRAHEQTRNKVQMKLEQSKMVHLEAFLNLKERAARTGRAALRTYAEEAVKMTEAYMDAGEPSAIFTKYVRLPRARKNVDVSQE